MDSLLSSIPFMDIPSVYLPPIFFHLPTQVYCMQSCIGANMSRLRLRQPKLSKDTVRVVCLYYVETHKWHDFPPHISPYNIEGRKVT